MSGVFRATLPIVLASASPRRSELLANAGLSFSVAPSASEPDPLPGEDPAAYACRAAAAKAAGVAADNPAACVLAADTIVVVGGDILGKPADAAMARDMLGRLAGRTHEVITGCCLVAPDRRMEFAAISRVTMAAWPADALAAYVATGEPMDKAGAYAIQGQGAFLVNGVEGSYTNVVGLPLAMVLGVLSDWGVIEPRA